MTKGREASGAERLRVYQLAHEFCADIERQVRARGCRRSLADQLLRAADSVVLNIAEGAGHFVGQRKLNFYRIARGSCYECLAGLRRLVRDRPTPQSEKARRKGEMVAIMLTALIRSLEHRLGQQPDPPRD